MRKQRIVFIGLGGNSYGPLLLALPINQDPERTEIVLVDGKKYRPSQADHEFFLREGNKAQVQALLLNNTYPNITTTPISKFVDRVTTKNTIAANELLRDGDCVILFVDNHETRRLVFEAAQGIDNITVISGATDRDDIHVFLHLRRQGHDRTIPPLLRYPDIRRANDELPEEMFKRTGCLEEAKDNSDGDRPNYFALVTASILTLNTLNTVLEHDQNGEPLQYTELWLNVRNANAIPNCHQEKT